MRDSRIIRLGVPFGHKAMKNRLLKRPYIVGMEIIAVLVIDYFRFKDN